MEQHDVRLNTWKGFEKGYFAVFQCSAIFYNTVRIEPWGKCNYQGYNPDYTLPPVALNCKNNSHR